MFEHFTLVQNKVWDTVVVELKKGKKQTHWIWFVFPQLKGLGTSEMANHFAISTSEMANEHLKHRSFTGKKIN